MLMLLLSIAKENIDFVFSLFSSIKIALYL